MKRAATENTVTGIQRKRPQVLPYPLWNVKRNDDLKFPGDWLAEQVINGSVAFALGKPDQEGQGEDENAWPWKFTPVGTDLLRRYLSKPLVKLVPAFLRECERQRSQKTVSDWKSEPLVKRLEKLTLVEARMIALGFIHPNDRGDALADPSVDSSITPRPWRDGWLPLGIIEGCLRQLAQDNYVERGNENLTPLPTICLAAPHLDHIYPFPDGGDRRVTEGIPKSGILDEDGQLGVHARAMQHRVMLDKMFESFKQFEASDDAKGLGQEVARLRGQLEEVKKRPSAAAASSALATCRSLQQKVEALTAKGRERATARTARPRGVKISQKAPGTETIILLESEQAVLKELEGKALSQGEVAQAVEMPEPSVRDILQRLRKQHLIKNKRGLGYFRPDALPQSMIFRNKDRR